MPEEINRVMADHVSELLLCPSERAVTNLAREGISRGVHLVGDVMSDTLNWVRQRIDSEPAPSPQTLGTFRAVPTCFVPCIVARTPTTWNGSAGILAALADFNERVIFPIHPRTRKAMESRQLQAPANVSLIDPLGYLEMMALARSARMILTDSGGLQKEAYWLGVPCVTLREETEWTETVDAGWNVLAGSDTERIVSAVRDFARPSFSPALVWRRWGSSKMRGLARATNDCGLLTKRMAMFDWRSSGCVAMRIVQRKEG